MDTDFAIYIKLVGIQKIKNDLKASLSEATVNRNWKLIKDIANFIDNFEIWEFLKSTIVEILEIEEDMIVNETVITPYQTDQKVHYDPVNYKYKDHWLVGLVPGLSTLATALYSDSYGYVYDDLDFMELIMAVEEEFDIEISDEQSENIVTIQDLYDVIISCLNDRESI